MTSLEHLGEHLARGAREEALTRSDTYQEIGQRGPGEIAQQPHEGIAVLGGDDQAGVKTELTVVGAGQHVVGLIGFEKSARNGVGWELGPDGFPLPMRMRAMNTPYLHTMRLITEAPDG